MDLSWIQDAGLHEYNVVGFGSLVLTFLGEFTPLHNTWNQENRCPRIIIFRLSGLNVYPALFCFRSFGRGDIFML